ncbi:hypothetical protein XENORESO_017482 [Xenotaenia resolanae]|uniref:Uncharacterized protein n=1 Tax=Xenotaenia resolanae TaxID=208358 RepID=A0ABV0W3G5_9TELE
MFLAKHQVLIMWSTVIQAERSQEENKDLTAEGHSCSSSHFKPHTACVVSGLSWNNTQIPIIPSCIPVPEELPISKLNTVFLSAGFHDPSSSGSLMQGCLGGCGNSSACFSLLQTAMVS